MEETKVSEQTAFAAKLQDFVYPLLDDNSKKRKRDYETETVLTEYKGKTKEMKALLKKQKEDKRRKLLRSKRNLQKVKGMEPSYEDDLPHEKELKKIALKGVVTLFNMIRTHRVEQRKNKVKSLNIEE
eukprot:snap_masked-scaffold_11-processed-gene-2.29-mRNA-1 protein AED:1.00 eAED:1.00 QI:0/-1/0/0/-1/1/1/0/127